MCPTCGRSAQLGLREMLSAMPLAEYNVQLYFEQPYHLTCNYVRTNDVK